LTADFELAACAARALADRFALLAETAMPNSAATATKETSVSKKSRLIENRSVGVDFIFISSCSELYFNLITKSATDDEMEKEISGNL